MTTTNVAQVLQERRNTHGDFKDHARVTQDLKTLINSRINNKPSTSPTFPPPTLSMRESLDMIAHKIGRILAGNPYTKDHWVDIAGYATLVANQLDELNSQQQQ